MPRAAIASSRCVDEEGPEPLAGPVLHARRRAPLGAGAAGRPFLPRALSVADAVAAATASALDFLIEGDRPRDRPPLRARGGRARSGSTARSATPSRRRASSRPAPPGRSWSAAASASPRWRSCAARFCDARRPDPRPARLPRPRALRRPRRPLRLLRGPPRERGRPRRPPRLRHRPAGGDARGRRRRQRRRLRLRPAADARGGATRSAPSAASPASSRMESPMACGFGACFGCAVPKPRRRLHAPLRRRARCVRGEAGSPERSSAVGSPLGAMPWHRLCPGIGRVLRAELGTR